MNGTIVLLRVEDDALEGWKGIPLEELLERIDLKWWKEDQEPAGVLLLRNRRRQLQ
jgi:hypothetical protein